MRARCPAALVASFALATPALAQEHEARPPLPEPIFTETITDIDGDEAGEFELEANAQTLKAWRQGARLSQVSLEIEALITSRLGARLEGGPARTTDVGGRSGSTDWSVLGGLSWKLLHDYEHDFHAQLEVGGRLPADTPATLSPGDPALPASADVRAAKRWGHFTLRASAGAEAGGASAHAPIRAGMGALFDLDAGSRHGFWGIEGELDAARKHPLFGALNVVPNLTSLGIPFAVGFALPIGVAANRKEPSVGFLVRLFFLSEREQEFRGPAKAPGRDDD